MKLAQDNQDVPMKDAKIVEVHSHSRKIAEAFMESMCKSIEKIQPPENDKQAAPEIRKIVDGGDQRNRIDVVFMGDGYTGNLRTYQTSTLLCICQNLLIPHYFDL